jgi:hypothetical protein
MGTHESYQFTQAISVSFKTGLDGYELYGMGAYISIGEGGRVLETYINTPQFQPYSLVPVEPPDMALSTFQDYLNYPTQFWADVPLCLVTNPTDYMKLTGMSLKYFCMPALDNIMPTFAQPVYVIAGEGRNQPDQPWSVLTGQVDGVARPDTPAVTPTI